MSMLGFESLSLPSATSSGADAESVAARLQRWWRERTADAEESAAPAADREVEEGDDEGNLLPGARRPSWMDSTWFAVPKRKPSYARKRRRQMNPLYQNDKELNVSI
jgi:hypothetical protein